jgi:glycosyltransferase involved in cell wall biosynthesis
MVMKRPTRVLHVLANLGTGGAERMAAHIAIGLDRQRFEVAVVAISEPFGTDVEQLLADAGVKVWYLGKGPGFDWRIYPRLHRVFREYRPDVLHTHVHVLRYTLPSMFYFRPALMLHTVHNLAEWEVEPRARFLQRFAFKHGIVPVAVAQEVAVSLQRLYQIPLCRVIGNCIPTDLYAFPQTPRATWRAKEGFADNDILFGCVARFAPQKNHMLLLEAFARGPLSDPRAHLILAGGGRDLLEHVKTRANDLGLAGRVHFLGVRTDVPDLLGAMDAFVLSSDYEGNPLSVLEAMAAGLPIVSTAAGGVPELIDNGKEGFIVPPGDLSGLAESMAFLLRDQKVRQSMGAAAARRAKERFDVSVMIKAYEELYSTLPSGRHSGRENGIRGESVAATAEQGIGQNR